MDRRQGIIKVCPGTLAEGFHAYSAACQKSLFSGKRVSHILPFDSPQHSEEAAAMFMENMKHISISGVQQKLSLVQEKNRLRLTNEGEQGTHILKPVPSLLKKAGMVPANEHLTMQVARQVYSIPAAANALIFFRDGTQAYITRRFDVKPDGTKWGKEDFATLAGKTRTSSENYKYESSYEELGLLIRQYVPAWKIEIEKYFSLVLFNFLFSNGDAHLKNFSILETSKGDYRLSPAYDLVNSRLHVDDSDFALTKGLFADGYRSAKYKRSGHPSKEDFAELGKRIGMNETRKERILAFYMVKQKMAETLISRSFLDDDCKRGYLLLYHTRRNYLAGRRRGFA